MLSPVSTEEPGVTFTRFVRGWFRLLAQEAFAVAISQLDEPTSYGERWNPAKLQGVIQDYARSQSVRVSDPATLAGDGSPSLVKFTDGRGFSFEHYVPLDGEWSDLTAQFEFLHRPGGYAVVLHDIHVL
ncbi:MAG: hypothetical protein B9S33_12405 [Pedosphaera sp. Tous-C6FEB]|nr:MAG: hypothetical protein B9S33_12405 [Pedosphaera sp. Tous-C6FEB]